MMQRQPSESKSSSPQDLINEVNQLIEANALALANSEHPDTVALLKKIKEKVVDENGQWKKLDRNENTALHLAVQHHNFEMVRILLLLEVNPIANRLGKTPADLAADQDDLLIEQFCRNAADRAKLMQMVEDQGYAIKITHPENPNRKNVTRDTVLVEWMQGFDKQQSYLKADLNAVKDASNRTSELSSNLAERQRIHQQFELARKTRQEKIMPMANPLVYQARQEGAVIINEILLTKDRKDKPIKHKVRLALAGDVNAIQMAKSDYNQEKDYGRAMLFACFAAVYCQTPETRNSYRDYIKDFDITKVSRLGRFASLKYDTEGLDQLQIFLLQCLKDDKLLNLKNANKELDLITLILMAIPGIEKSDFLDPRNYAAEGTKKLISSIESVIADSHGVKKEKDAGLSEELRNKLIAAHNLKQQELTLKQEEKTEASPVTVHMPPQTSPQQKRKSTYGSLWSSSDDESDKLFGEARAESPKSGARPGRKQSES